MALCSLQSRERCFGGRLKAVRVRLRLRCREAVSALGSGELYLSRYSLMLVPYLPAPLLCLVKQQVDPLESGDLANAPSQALRPLLFRLLPAKSFEVRNSLSFRGICGLYISRRRLLCVIYSEDESSSDVSYIDISSSSSKWRRYISFDKVN